jgi:sigma-B regulation protein RsbU (phosphoserine phosphatase)
MPPPAAPTVLLSGPPQSAPDDLRRALAGSAFAVADHALGATAPVDFGPVVVAVIEVGDKPDVAAAQTRRWRIELGDEFIPVVWVLPAASPELAARGLDAGADACLARPLDLSEFVAQVKAAARGHATAARLAVKAAESLLLGDQLQKAYAQLDRELEMARRVHRAFLPRSFPEVGPARFAVCYRPRSRVGGDFYDVRRLDEDHVGFFVADVIGHAAAVGSLLSVFVRQSANWKSIVGTRYRLIPPDDVLAGVNRDLLGLGLEDPPLVAMLAGTLNVRAGTLTVARAGLPSPVFLPAAGEARAWAVPGPFLGTAETTYQLHSAVFAPGDKLIVGTDGTRAGGEPSPQGPDELLAAATRHRGLGGQAFVDALARDLLPHVRHPDDFTLLAVEMV